MHILLNSGKNLFQTAIESIEEHLTPQTKKKLITKNMARDEHGPEFDDRLINLVRENPAIYDVSHPHYRRTPVRMAIWDNIARELGAPSRYLQTKWKNIRYNYLQEQKCLETGIFNANIRKRRFTADLTFLKHTAYRRDPAPGGTVPNTKQGAYNGTENDNTVMYPDNLSTNVNSGSFEVIELDHSDDEGSEYMPDVSAFLAPMKDMNDEDSPQDPYAQPDIADEPKETKTSAKALCRQTRSANLKMNETRRSETPKINKIESGVNSPESPLSSKCSSPLLTPMKSDKPENLNGNNDNNDNTSNKNGNFKFLTNGSNNTTLSEVTIRPVYTGQQIKRRPSSNLSAADQNLTNRELQPFNSSTHDPIELYCLSLVDCFRAMPRSERERVKFEFSKILKDAQYTNQS